MNSSTSYTHAEWRVMPGREEEFIAAWRALSETFFALEHPPLWGTLLQSEAEPTVFYSFGPWESREDIAAMRADPTARAAMDRVVELCESVKPGPCRLVSHVDVGDSGARPR